MFTGLSGSQSHVNAPVLFFLIERNASTAFELFNNIKAADFVFFLPLPVLRFPI